MQSLQVATEGDAFTMAFHDPIDAIAWALNVQHRLLLLPWSPDILEHPECMKQHAAGGAGPAIFAGLRVRMAIHTGKPDSIQVWCPASGWFGVQLSCASHASCCALTMYTLLVLLLPDL